MNANVDRDRGVLTPADRAYLLGQREMSHDQSRRNAEARIRNRVHQAALDFDLLLHALPEKDREQLFERTHHDDEFLDGLRAMVAFLYVGLDRHGVEFRDVLEPAVRSSEEALAATDLDANVSVDVTFDVETSVQSDVDGIASRLDAGNAVTPRELFSVVMQGEYDVGDQDRIRLIRSDEHPVDEEFLDRLATYLDGDVEESSGRAAVLRLDCDE